MKTLEGFRIDAGEHLDGMRERVGCAMELQSYLAGERWSDEPKCVHPAIAVLARRFNDRMTAVDRTAYMLPFVVSMAAVGTRGTNRTRNLIFGMADIAVRKIAPCGLRARCATTMARHFESLPAIVDEATGNIARAFIDSHNTGLSAHLRHALACIALVIEYDALPSNIRTAAIESIAINTAVAVAHMATVGSVPASEYVNILTTLCHIAKGTTP